MPEPEANPGIAFRAYHGARAAAAVVNRALDRPGTLPALPPAPPSSCYLVYRKRNAAVAGGLARAAEDAGGVAHLWALDEPAPELERWTRGSGPEPKFPLLRRMIALHPPREDDYVVIADDDVEFRRGSYARFLAVMAAAGLDLAQPPHAGPHNISHVVTIVRPRVIARTTSLVEIGPLFAVSPGLFPRWLADLDGVNMGWGLEARWSTYTAAGFRIGMTDAVTIRHLGKVGVAYDVPEARAERDRIFAETGVESIQSLAVTLQRWPRGTEAAPWLAGETT